MNSIYAISIGKISEKQSDTENVKCRTCKYRMELSSPRFVGCQYILITHVSRGEWPADECSFYEEGDYIRFTKDWTNPETHSYNTFET